MSQSQSSTFLGHARENERAHVLGLDFGGFGYVDELREKPRDLDRVSDLRKVAGALDQLEAGDGAVGRLIEAEEADHAVDVDEEDGFLRGLLGQVR